MEKTSKKKMEKNSSKMSEIILNSHKCLIAIQ